MPTLLIRGPDGTLVERELERAARAFRDALELDAKLIPEGDSALKHNVERGMSAKAYALGTLQADHEDWRRACAAWKLGFSFFKASAELNASLMKDCTNRARALTGSTDCKQLAEALEYAVPGDDLEAQLKERRSTLGCP